MQRHIRLFAVILFLGLLVFVLLFSLGNLIQIPGWLFLAAAVLALGRTWGGDAAPFSMRWSA